MLHCAKWQMITEIL